MLKKAESKTERIALRITPSLRLDLERLSKEYNLTLSDVIFQLLESSVKTIKK